MIRKLLIGTVSLVALFAVAGAGLFFVQPTAAQSIPIMNQFGDRAGQFADGDRNFGDKEQFLTRAAEHLGMTVEALQAELDAGKSMREIAQEQGVDLPQGRGRGGKHGQRGGKLGVDIDRHVIMADALGITVEELAAAREAGTKLDELAAANGTTVEAIKEAMLAATTDAINQAVASGEMTQEQADMVLAKIELQVLARDIFSKEDAKAAAADAMGITVEELEAAHEAGTKSELAEANGTTVEAVKEAVKAAREAAIQAAVDDGTLTAEQGEQLLNGRNGFGKRGHGKHGHGGRGGSGPSNGAVPVQADA